MLFNGWQYVGSPAIGCLEKVAPSSRSYGLRSNLLLKVAGTKSGTKISLVELCEKALPKSFYVACSLLVSISTHNRVYTSE